MCNSGSVTHELRCALQPCSVTDTSRTREEMDGADRKIAARVPVRLYLALLLLLHLAHASLVTASPQQQHQPHHDGGSAEQLVQTLLDRATAPGDALGSTPTSAVRGVNSRDHNGATPLIYAAGIGSTSAIKLLLRRGAVVGAADEYGMTALHRAAEGGMLEACQVLLAHGASKDAKDQRGLKPGDIAHAWGYPVVAELLGHPTPWASTTTSAGRGPPFNADGTEEPLNPRWKHAFGDEL